MIDKLDLKTMNITQAQKEKLKELFPEVFTEGKIDFEILKLTLGEDIDSSEERFGLTWAGKADCFKVIQEPSVGTLKPCREESINWDTTENLFIEGDNLEVLKQLQKAYYGKVKMIYIDPPYNTGNEFIYPDKYQENLDTYLAYTGQVDEEGKKFSTNTETTGRFHSNWLNMMYPRLFLARNILAKDGLLFISIDENEAHNLTTICDEIFGEENRLVSIVWEKRYTRSNNAKTFATLTETILCYRKSIDLDVIKEPRNEKADSTYSNPDNDERGVWTSVSYVNPANKEQRPNLVYPIINPFTGEKVEHPSNAWKYEYKVYEKHVKENRLYWGKEGNNTYPRLKKFLSEMDGGMVPVDFWNRNDTGTTDEGSKELEKLLGGKFFDFPKPHSLVKRAIKLTNDENAICLDFFAGSCPSAQAVLELNKEDGGNRKFIMVQLPEPTDEKSEAYKAGYKTIADIGKERIRRVIQNIQAEQEEKQKQKAGELDFGQEEVTGNKQDLGFKVFKLDRSNFKIWDGEVEKKPIEEQLQLNIHRIDPSSSEEDLLYEILLKSGFQPTVPVTKINLAGKTVFSVAEDALLICIEKDLTKEVIKAVAEKQPIRAVFLDDGFKGNDQLKTNAVQIMKSHDVKEFKTV